MNSRPNPANPIILMGVSGAGKTAVGTELASRLGWRFFDGDEYHSDRNIQKMAEGIPLTDEDRLPWLSDLHDLVADQMRAGNKIVLACSALKRKHRDQLAKASPDTAFVFLKGDFDLILKRMRSRPGHFMKADMLRSQFQALEEPMNALVVDVDRSLAEAVTEIVKSLGLEDHQNVQTRRSGS